MEAAGARAREVAPQLAELLEAENPLLAYAVDIRRRRPEALGCKAPRGDRQEGRGGERATVPTSAVFSGSDA